MKYFIGVMLIFAAMLTFLPSHYSNGIRNLPLLIAILSVFAGYHIIHAARHGAAKVSIAQTNGYDSTSLAGKRKLPFQNESVMCESNIIIMDRLPRCVTDSVSRHELSSGNTLCGCLQLYEMKR